MGNLFSYENPIMQILMKVGDLIILNFLFLICCLPVFTIGASSAGLYTAMKVMFDKEDDSSLVEAFFRGFKNGFKTITIAHLLLLVVSLVVAAAAMIAYAYGLQLWICLLPVGICVWYISQIPAFHSRFGCTVIQLVRNVWFLIIAHPLRTLGVAVLTIIPVVLFLGDLYIFMSMMPIWCTLYFSTAASFNYILLRKPFHTLIEHFTSTHTPEGEPLPDNEELTAAPTEALPEAEDEAAEAAWDEDEEDDTCEAEDDAPGSAEEEEDTEAAKPGI